MRPVSFLLVHGAYHRAWHLHLLNEKLEEAGYAVSTIDLPGSDENPPAAGGLKMDTIAIRRAIEDATKSSTRVIPVFHSYAGFPGSEAVAGLSLDASERIYKVVYLAAAIPRQFEALAPPNGMPAAWIDPEDSKVIVPDPIPRFYHDVEPELARQAAERVVPHSLSCFLTKTTQTGWRMYPSTYVLCADDRAIPPWRTKDRFADMSDEDKKAWTFFTIDGGHSPFLSRPDDTARLLRKIAGENLVVNARAGLITTH